MAATIRIPTGKVTIEPTRRQFAAMGVVAGSMLGWRASAASAPIAIKEHIVNVPNGSGHLAAKLFRSEAGEQPGLVMFAFGAASPSANAAVARKLAEQGWSVLLVDPPKEASPQAINRDARAHFAWLKAQPGVVSTAQSGGAEDFRLQAIAAAYPRLSLASRDERQAASRSAVLFAVPSKPDNKNKALAESLAGAARALHRFAAGPIGASMPI